MNRFRLLRHVSVALSLTLLATLAARPAAAQVPSDAPGQLFLVHQEIANPARLAGYESTTKELIAAVTAAKMSKTPFDWTTVALDDLSYAYILPIQSFADVGDVSKGFAELAGKMGPDKFADLMRRGGEAELSWNDFVVRERPDLSYHPQKPRLQPAEVAAIRYETYYLNPGHEGDAEEIARTWVKAMQRLSFADGFTLYEGVSGHDLPAFVVAVHGKSKADIDATDERLDKALGAEMEALRLRTMTVVRRFETHYGTLRADLSYHPATAQAAK